MKSVACRFVETFACLCQKLWTLSLTKLVPYLCNLIQPVTGPPSGYIMALFIASWDADDVSFEFLDVDLRRDSDLSILCWCCQQNCGLPAERSNSNLRNFAADWPSSCVCSWRLPPYSLKQNHLVLILDNGPCGNYLNQIWKPWNYDYFLSPLTFSNLSPVAERK